MVGLQVGSLFGGAVLTETIFAWPGVGNWLIQSIQRRDYPVLQGGMLLVATIIILRQPAGRRAGRHHQPARPARTMTHADDERHFAPRHADRSRAASSLGDFWRHYASGRGGVIGLAVIAILVLAALFAPLLAPHDPDEQMRDALLQPPTWFATGPHAYPLGTDDVGRDILSRLLYGARLSLSIGAMVVVIALAIGTILGLLAGFFSGIVDALLMRLMDIMLALPTHPARHRRRRHPRPRACATRCSPSPSCSFPASSASPAPRCAAERSREYVTASRMAGARLPRLMFLTVLPNCMAPLIVQASLGFSSAILDTAALGFLGLGAQPPTPGMGHDARRRAAIRAERLVGRDLPGPRDPADRARLQPVGDGLRDALDPRLKR